MTNAVIVIPLTAVGSVTNLMTNIPEVVELQGAAGSVVTISYLGISGLAPAVELATLTVDSGYTAVFSTDVLDWRAGMYRFNLTTLPSGTAQINWGCRQP